MIDDRRLLETLRAFIEAPSPQSDLEQVRAFNRDVVRPRLPTGFFDSVDMDEDGNLVARKVGASDDAPVLLGTYGGTFPAESMADAFEAKEVDGSGHGIPGPAIQGRGVTEQVAGLASAVEALWALAEDGASLRRGLLFVTTIAGEMGSHEIVDAMARRGSLDAGAGILAVGTNNALCLGNMGRLDVHVEVRGRSCHSSTPNLGLNAIEGAQQVLAAFRSLQLDSDPDLGTATLTPTSFETWPKAMHTVPDLARLILDRRLVPGEEADAAMADITGAASGVADFEVDVRLGKFNLPNKVAPDAEVARAVSGALEAVTGSAPTTYWRAALDAGYLTRSGAPTVMFGPGDIRLAHTDFELVSKAQVREAADVLLRAIERLCVGG